MLLLQLEERGDRKLTDESINEHVPLLSVSMDSSHRLSVRRRVPIRVEHDESMETKREGTKESARVLKAGGKKRRDSPRSSDQVQSSSSTLRTQQEDELRRLRSLIESIDHILTLGLRGFPARYENEKGG